MRSPESGYRGPDGDDVRDMFAAIAPRYDLLNHLLSASVDRRWRRKVVQLIASKSPVENDRCLDICTGTGDLAIDIGRALGIRTVGTDFCHPMLVGAVAKAARRGLSIGIAESDAQSLPFAESTFKFATVAFGLRNVESPERALGEIHRVLQPGGWGIVLEFARPVVPVFGALFDFYFVHVLPRIGRLVSGVDGPYRYLPASVKRFPAQGELPDLIRKSGLVDVGYRNLTGGIAALYWGRKPPTATSSS